MQSVFRLVFFVFFFSRNRVLEFRSLSLSLSLSARTLATLRPLIKNRKIKKKHSKRVTLVRLRHALVCVAIVGAVRQGYAGNSVNARRYSCFDGVFGTREYALNGAVGIGKPKVYLGRSAPPSPRATLGKIIRRPFVDCTINVRVQSQN